MFFVISLAWMVFFFIYGQNMKLSGDKGLDLYMKYMCPFLPLLGYLFNLLEK